MRPYLLLGITLLASLAAYATFRGIQSTPTPSMALIEKYNAWRAKFGKLYASPAEHNFRLQVFGGNLAIVEDSNTEYNQYLAANDLPPVTKPMFDVNKFSDQTVQEFKKRFTGLNSALRKPSKQPAQANLDHLLPKPQSMLQQVVYKNRVRDQSSCGSCWAFSSVATTEKFHFHATGQQVDLSQQDLVDCSEENNACDGGHQLTAYDHMAEYGVSLASAYPYKNKKTTCKQNVSRITFENYAQREVQFNIANTKKLCNEQGVVAGIDIAAGSPKFMQLSDSRDVYDARAFKADCKLALDHAVVLVSAQDNYVVMQNSWGTGWGEDGFKRIIPCQADTLVGKDEGAATNLMHPYQKL